MALRRYSKPCDGTIPVQALLYDDERLFSSQDNVGIYDGTQKSPDHQSGTAYVTTHRLFYIDAQRPEHNSFEIALSYVTQTEYYAGLFKSSPKVTCHLSGDPDPSALGSGEPTGTHVQSDTWECEVCAYRNPPGLSPAASRICGLCGVPRSAPTTSGSSHQSSSLPSSALSSSTSLAQELPHSASHKQTSIACPACTFLNHPYLRACELCGTELQRAKGEYRSAPSSRPITPAADNDDDLSPKMIKISFRKGGDKPFYAQLKLSLRNKTWEGDGTAPAPLNTANAPVSVGISGILRTVENSAKGRETNMRDALQDLEALMVKAKDMVKLAAELNEKLTAASASSSNNTVIAGAAPGAAAGLAEPEEATFIRSSLSQLGMQIANTPVTLDMMSDERKWLDELARELTRVLQGTPGSNGGLMKERGIIALDEVWGGWNRARGVALIPPATFLQVIPRLSMHSEPAIRHRAFPSGLNVLHTPPYTAVAFEARLSGWLIMAGPQTTVEVAAEENLTIALVTEMLNGAEAEGGICRDDSSAALIGGGTGTGIEVRWWPNVFAGYRWDGQED